MKLRDTTRGVIHRIGRAYREATAEAVEQVRRPVERAIREFVAERYPGLSSRRYDAAKGGRKTDNWRTNGSSANAEIGRDIVKLRDRGSDLIRNDPTAKRGIKIKVLHTVGAGIIPKCNTMEPASPEIKALGFATLDAYVDAKFEKWQANAGADGVTSWYAQQAVVTQAMFERGEALVVRTPRRYRELEVPLQIDALEGDHLDHMLNGEWSEVKLQKGHYLRHGIEFDAGGRRVAYHCWRDHPGESGAFLRSRSLEHVRIDARDLGHVYRPTRLGQVRGVTDLAAVILQLRQMGLYKDAELERKGTEALVVGVVHGADPAYPGVGDVTEETDAGGITRHIGDMESGAFLNFPNTTGVEFNHPQPTDPASSLKGYLQAVASGLDITYEFLSSDLSNTNLSSIRYGSLPMRTDTYQTQWHVLIPRYCQRVWEWWCDAAMAAGVIPFRDGGYPVKWAPPRWEEIDRLKEAMADVLEIRAGLRSYQDVLSTRGESWRETLDECAAFIREMEGRGVSLDSDPRRPESAAAIIAKQVAVAPAPIAPAPAESGAAPDIGRALDVVQEVAVGALSREAGQALLETGFPDMTRKQIRALLESGRE